MWAPPSTRFVRATGTATYNLLDVRTRRDVEIVERVTLACGVRLGEQGGWDVSFSRELHQTDDKAWFKKAEELEARGFTRVTPERAADGTWSQRKGPTPGKVAGLPKELPSGGAYWIAASADYYRARGYTEVTLDGGGVAFVHPKDIGCARSDAGASCIHPREVQRALYEGRLVHQYDHAQRRYLRGEGRKAVWDDSPIQEKRFEPRAFAHRVLQRDRANQRAEHARGDPPGLPLDRERPLHGQRPDAARHTAAARAAQLVHL